METAKLMLGIQTYESLDINLNISRLIPLYYGNISFIESIKSLCQLIDSYQCDSDLLKHFNIDELFYRIIVTMLIPEKFFYLEPSANPKSSSVKFNDLIEYSNAHPDFLNTLSDLEKFTGLSTRSLQYAFSEKLHITPKRWLRQLKMKQARDMITAGHGYVSVTQAAMECGFSNFSLFARYYREQFLELPSKTLKRVNF